MTHEQMYAELLNRMKRYHPSKDFTMIADVYDFAAAAHMGQFRKSGDPYIIHPMSAALILADIRSDMETVAAGILHDVLEDTEYTYDEIRERFGHEIAELVRGVTKLKTLKYVSKEEEQAENYRQLFLSMSDDIRVILIKMADRLHNMRTLEFRSPEAQRSVAQETLDIYAPLASRLGIAKFADQLEDLSFKYLRPDDYDDLLAKLKQKVSERQSFIANIVYHMRKRLEKDGVNGKVAGRVKHLFSIYKKMVSQSKTLDQIYDILAVRITVGSKEDCYAALGMVHENYKPIPGRFKDYIAMPKSNRYQSLHTTIIGHTGAPFEVQIRTYEMDAVAEYGIAAHWKYKQRYGGIVDAESEEEKFAWLRRIIEWQIEMSDNKEYLSAVKDDLNIYKDHVYCFTPKGDVINLLKGSNPIDFAYAIHSAVGNKMVGARVGGKIVPFDHVLNNGDQVEIVTSNNSRGPSMDWLKLVKTSQARTKINQWFKKENKEENIAKGRALLEKEAARKKFDARELNNKKRQAQILNRYGFSDWDSLCAAVGHGGVKEGQVVNRLIDEYNKEIEEKEIKENPVAKLLGVTKDAEANAKEEGKPRKNTGGIFIDGIGDVGVRFSRCCRPVPGDEIIAYVTRGRGVSLHRTDCANIINLDESERNRLIEAEWGLEGGHYLTDLRILCKDRPNLLMDLSRVLAEDNGVKVTYLNIKAAKLDQIITVGLEVSNRDQLDVVCNKIFGLSGVYEVNRLNA